MVAERGAVVAQLRSWLVSRRPGTDPLAIDDHTDLVATRIIDSLQLIEFVLLIEELCGRTVLTEDLDPDHLRTLDRVYRRFFE